MPAKLHYMYIAVHSTYTHYTLCTLTTLHAPTHCSEGVVIQEGLVVEQRSVQVHEEGLDGAGIYSGRVARTGGGGVRVQQ